MTILHVNQHILKIPGNTFRCIYEIFYYWIKILSVDNRDIET